MGVDHRYCDVDMVVTVSKRHAHTEAERRKRRLEKYRRYDQSPKGKYNKHKKNAKRRGIPFLLTFKAWLRIWKRSGKWTQRGNATTHNYVMARKGDTGAYEEGNVQIVTHGTNIAERNVSVVHPDYKPPSWHGAAARYKRKQRERSLNGEPGDDVPF